MKISIVNNEAADKFSLIITNLHRFCESVILHFKPNQFYIQGMDFSQVALFEVCLGSDDFFDVYDISDNDSDNVGIRTAVLQKIFNTRDAGQPVSMNYTGEPDNIEISFENKKDDTKYIPKYFTIPLIEIEQAMLSIPDSEYPIEFSIPTKTFSTLVAQLLGFGDEIKFKCKVCFTFKKVYFSIAICNRLAASFTSGYLRGLSFNLNNSYIVNEDGLA